VNCNSANNLRNSQAVHEIFICSNSTGGLWGPLGLMQWVPGFFPCGGGGGGPVVSFQGLDPVGLHLHSSIRLHGMHRAKLYIILCVIHVLENAVTVTRKCDEKCSR